MYKRQQTDLLGGADKPHRLYDAGIFADMPFRQPADHGQNRNRKRQDNDHWNNPTQIW